MLTERVEQWRREGSVEEVLGRRLFVRRAEGSESPLLLYLHGFPSSSYDWRPLLEERPGPEASIAFDFLGFGLSEKPADHLSRLGWQADATEELVRRAGSPPVFVVAHDMGTSVATELMARDLSGELEMNLRGRCSSTAACCCTWRSRSSGRNCCAAASGRSSPASRPSGPSGPSSRGSSPPSTL